MTGTAGHRLKMVSTTTCALLLVLRDNYYIETIIEDEPSHDQSPNFTGMLTKKIIISNTFQKIINVFR